MQPKLIEIKPNRLLIDPKFNGFKLSLSDIPSITHTFQIGVDTVTPNLSQFSYLHARLYTLHNYLIPDPYDDNDSVYFIDKEWQLQKIQIDPRINEFSSETVWKIPKNRDRIEGDYNITLKFASDNIAVVSDGTGFIHLLNKSQTSSWVSLFSNKIEGTSANFIISDAISINDEVNLLLTSVIDGDSTTQSYSLLNWVTIKLQDTSVQNLRQLSCKGSIQYANFDRNGNSLYVASDTNLKLLGESESNPKIDDQKRYSWTQNKDDITVTFNLDGSTVKKSLVNVVCKSDFIRVVYNEDNLICGDLFQRIDVDSFNWTVDDSQKSLTLELSKLEAGLMWSEVVRGDNSGEYIPDHALIEEAHKTLSKLTSDIEVESEMGLTFNSEQVEECDYECDKTTIFERYSMADLETTHRVNLGSRQILFSLSLNQNLPPAIALRHDVDTFIWQPLENLGNFVMEHQGTLSALGYIQASKQQRRFFSSCPDLSYSVISESRKHIFIYRQNKSVQSGELKNRTTGQKVKTLAQQQVFNLPTSSDDILGIHCTNSTIYVLTENYITGLNLS